MKILITGALGHIGSKLIHSIRPGEFEEVHMLDNLSTQRYASLFNLPKGVNFKFIEDDILETDLSVVMKDIDAVISNFQKNKIRIVHPSKLEILKYFSETLNGKFCCSLIFKGDLYFNSRATVSLKLVKLKFTFIGKCCSSI